MRNTTIRNATPKYDVPYLIMVALGIILLSFICYIGYNEYQLKKEIEQTYEQSK